MSTVTGKGSSAVLEEMTLTLGAGFGVPHTPKWAESSTASGCSLFPHGPDGDYEGRSSENEASAPLSVVPCRRHGCTTAGRLQASAWLGLEAAKAREGVGFVTQTPERQHASWLTARVLHQASPSCPCGRCDSCEQANVSCASAAPSVKWR